MTLALMSSALRRRPFAMVCAALLLVALASLLGASAPTALLAWLALSAASLEIWHTLECVVLQRLGYRRPTSAERERLEPAIPCDHLDILVFDSPELWVGRGLRCVVVTRTMLDLLEDRALLGLLHATTVPVRRAALAGHLLVSLGALPMLLASWLGQGLTLLGRLLARTIGVALVLPVVFWPRGFVLWAGRLFGGMLVGLVGSALVACGSAAPGVAVLMAWVVVPGLRALLAWETCRAEAAADQATIKAGLGWELVEALELLQVTEPLPKRAGVQAILSPQGTPLGARVDRIRRALCTA
jgi:hypothetical protein